MEDSRETGITLYEDDVPSVTGNGMKNRSERESKKKDSLQEPEDDVRKHNSEEIRKSSSTNSGDYGDKSSTSSGCSESFSRGGGDYDEGGNKNGKRHRSRRSETRRKVRRHSRSKSSERGKRRHEKKRHRRRSSSSSKSRSRSRSRSRTRSKNSRYNRKGSERGSRRTSKSKEDYYSDCNGARKWEPQPQYDSYKYQEPNRTVMIRGLALHLNEIDVREEVLKCGITVKDIRVVKNHTTGESRGFAFVEFNSIEDSIEWMNKKQGLLVLHGKFHASVIYSIPKAPNVMLDWTCEQCSSCNFKRREFCYKCDYPRPKEVASDRGDDENDAISTHPTTRIILSNLDILTTEEGVLQSLQSKPSTKSIPIKSVKIAREAGSSMSKGKCYVEANNISDAYMLFSIFSQENFQVDGRNVLVAYGKTANRFTHSKNSNVAAAALAAAQWTNSTNAQTSLTATGPPCTGVKTKDDVEKMAQYYAFHYAKTQEEFSANLDYYRKYYEEEVTKQSATSNIHTESKSNLEAFSQRQSTHECPSVHNIKKSVGALQPNIGWSDKPTIRTQQSVPDAKSFQYDETTGYYFDPISGLYYDATTQYYYDSEKQEFLYWNPHERNYLALSGNNYGNANGCTSNQKEQNGAKQEKTETAKRITKKMEKWAKTLNQKKQALKQVQEGPSVSDETSSICMKMASSTLSSSIACKNSNLLDQELENTKDENISTFQPILNESGPKDDSVVCTGDVVTFNTASKKFISVDENKLTCLICRRKFPSRDVLQKHVTKSDLHKKNLETLQRGLEESVPESSSPVTSLTYRDRAQERRERLGSDLTINNNVLKDLYLKVKTEGNLSNCEKPASSGIKEDNIGNRILQKMGWNEGQGLGRENQGTVDIITVERRSGTYGLGIRVPKKSDEKLDSRTEAQKITLARYHELE